VGVFAVVRSNPPLTIAQVGSRKARILLALLAVERGRLVPVDRAIEAVWGDDAPRNPIENVATLVSRLRAALGPEAIWGGRAGYRLGQAFRVDLYEAATMVTEAETRLARAEPILAMVAAKRAVELLGGGPVLADEPDATWAEPARTRHVELLRRARLTMADAALRTGDTRLAVAAAETATVADPLDEPAYRTLMQAYHAAGEPARALGAYERLRAALRQELGVDPSTATGELHVAILQNRAVTPSAAASPAAESPVAERDAGGERLVGREREMALLTGAWTDAVAGGCRLMLITGEAGIGKSRLADELIRLAEGTGGVVAQARCHRAERTLPLLPVAEALLRPAAELPAEALREAAGDGAGVLAAMVPELVTMLGVDPTGPDTGWTSPRRRHDAVAGFLRRLSATRPVLLVLDDLHQADAATVQLVHYLARHASDARLMVAATVQTGEGESVLAALAEVAGRVDLERLDATAVARLAAAAGLRQHIGWLERRTRGHTLCVVETLRALASGEPGIPPTLWAAVLHRVRRAGPQAEELLRAAAVLEDTFTPAGIAALLDISGAQAARRCERVLAAGLITVAGEGYEFANDIIRQIVHDNTPAPTREEYHRAAERLSAGRQAAVPACRGGCRDRGQAETQRMFVPPRRTPSRVSPGRGPRRGLAR
jgi:DNA-binding SARP family transcriptional activator